MSSGPSASTAAESATVRSVSIRKDDRRGTRFIPSNSSASAPYASATLPSVSERSG